MGSSATQVVSAPPRLSVDQFEQLWPTAHERLLKTLCGSGFDPATAEDAIAEAAARALARGLPFADLDDFCRWGFTVARNVARDLTRDSARFVVLDALPERADSYDLAGHVEMRERWQDTARALRSLSVGDKAAILDTISGTDEEFSRREAVKHAVRRHRARLRLRAALGQVGAFVGWVRRPRRLPLEWLSAYDRQAAALLPSMLAAVLPWLAPGAAAPSASPDAPMTASAAPVAAPSSSDIRSALGGGEMPGGTFTAALPTATPAPQAESAPQPHGVAFQFTPSPAYEDDGTIFATTSQRSEDCEVGPCSWLFKSTDRGATWTALPGYGGFYGQVLLPPAYPRDPRIIVAGQQVVSVSDDGGVNFRVLGPSTGPAAMSPLFSDGDPRILIGAHPYSPNPVATQYVDGEAGVQPSLLPLPHGVVALQFWFSPEFARDGRMLVHALEAPVDVGAVAAPQLQSYALFDCTTTACRRVIDNAAAIVSVAWTSPSTAFVSSHSSLYRSLDGGRSFAEIPGPLGRRMIGNMRRLPDGRLLVSVHNKPLNSLFASGDQGGSWTLVQSSVPEVTTLTVLPDGALLGWTVATRGITCSTDGGETWQASCRRP